MPAFCSTTRGARRRLEADLRSDTLDVRKATLASIMTAGRRAKSVWQWGYASFFFQYCLYGTDLSLMGFTRQLGGPHTYNLTRRKGTSC